MNQNYKTQFHMQCDYLLGFQVERRINQSILLQKWMRNTFNNKDDAYKTLILAYNRELDFLVLANSITRSDVEEESSPPYPENVVMNSKKETMNSKDTTPMPTPHFATSSNKLNIDQWHLVQLNMFEIKSNDEYEIGNNCQAWQEKSYEELCVAVNKSL
jgi:hypothetical protein